jgi:hypothetical protein
MTETVDCELLVNPHSDPAAWQREMLKTPVLRQVLAEFDRSRFIALVRSAGVAKEVCRGTITMCQLVAARDQQRAVCGAVLALRGSSKQGEADKTNG